MDNAFTLIRLGQVYLLRAEALARVTGDWNDALTYTNVIRCRDGESLMTSIDDSSFLA